MGAVIRLSIVAGLAGCVNEYDVDVYAVLPEIEHVCPILGATSLRLDVQPIDGDPFSVTASPCEPQLAGQAVSGFHTQLQQLTAGYHRVTATVDADDTPLGAIDVPFSPMRPLVIPFARADLPRWPTAKLALSLAGCAGNAHVTATPALATAPTIDLTMPCAAPAEMVAPRGPLAVSATADCAAATMQLDVFDDDTVEVALTRTCP